jgi:hypothetical protein
VSPAAAEKLPVRLLRLRADESAAGYPPYNIEKTGDDNYRIMMALLSTAMRRGFIASGNSRSRSSCRTPSASVAPTILTWSCRAAPRPLLAARCA